MPSATAAIVKTWNDQSLANHGRGTPCRPFSPPVTSVHLNAISNAICEKASVSKEKYRPRRRRMISAITAASSSEKITATTSASISLPTAPRMAIAAA